MITRLVKTALYNLKRLFGRAITYYRFQSTAVNTQTGVMETTYESIPMTAITGSFVATRKYPAQLEGIFDYGGQTIEAKDYVIVELTFAPTTEDQIEYNGTRYAIAQIVPSFANIAYLLVLEQIK